MKMILLREPRQLRDLPQFSKSEAASFRTRHSRPVSYVCDPRMTCRRKVDTTKKLGLDVRVQIVTKYMKISP